MCNRALFDQSLTFRKYRKIITRATTIAECERSRPDVIRPVVAGSSTYAKFTHHTTYTHTYPHTRTHTVIGYIIVLIYYSSSYERSAIDAPRFKCAARASLSSCCRRVFCACLARRCVGPANCASRCWRFSRLPVEHSAYVSACNIIYSSSSSPLSRSPPLLARTLEYDVNTLFADRFSLLYSVARYIVFLWRLSRPIILLRLGCVLSYLMCLLSSQNRINDQ